MNANDALFNATGQPQPQNKYYYPGGTIGGPVLIPGTRFNKNRNKLFFFTGYEYFYQVLDTGLLRATVPTPGMLHRQLLALRDRQDRPLYSVRRPSGTAQRSGAGSVPRRNHPEPRRSIRTWWP